MTENELKKLGDEVTPEVACQFLGGDKPVAASTLRGWVSEHKHRKLLSPIRYSCKCVRFPVQGLISFKNACRAQF